MTLGEGIYKSVETIASLVVLLFVFVLIFGNPFGRGE